MQKIKVKDPRKKVHLEGTPNLLEDASKRGMCTAGQKGKVKKRSGRRENARRKLSDATRKKGRIFFF